MDKTPSAETPVAGAAEADLAAVERLYDAGRYVDAFHASRALGDGRHWPGVLGQVLAGRLARHLGGERQSCALHTLCHRRHRDHPVAALYYAYTLMHGRGPWTTWRFMQAYDLPADEVEGWPNLHADWLAARARVLAWFRDFTAADRTIAEALKLAPADTAPWLHVQHGGVLEAEDRYDEALEACQRALAINAHHVPALHASVHVLTLLDRRDEAVALLERTAPELQCGMLWWQLAGLYREREQHDQEHEAIQRATAAMPLLDKSISKSIAGRLSDTSYHRGDIGTAINLAREAGGHFFDTVAKQMSRPDADTRRRLLSLPFVRQHHMTCAPATLAAVARYWNRPADHIEVAEAICYDGTPWHSERDWAEQQGYAVREFKVTFDAAAALIDRGVPFTLSTIEATSAHLQAVIGYDARRHTLLLRDPYLPYVGEMLGDALQDRYAATGPRGLALAPADEAHRLTDLELPDAALYDANHAMNKALLRHDRDAAVALLDGVEQGQPDHPMVLSMRSALASYDADPLREFETTDALLAKFPQDESLLMRRCGLLMRLDRRDEAIEQLERAIARPDSDPAFRERLADVLADDARNAPRVRRMLRRLLRERPTAASLYFLLARTLWEDVGQRQVATDLYRFAASLEDKNERYTAAYFVVQQHARQTDAALAGLAQRAKRYGHKSAGPTLTWFDALQRTGRLREALQALRDGIERRPDDGDLLLTATTEHAACGELDEARRLLERAAACARRGSWLRAAAVVDEYDGRLTEALKRWQTLVEDEPLNLEARQRVAQLMAELQSPDAAIIELATACKRFPYFLGLHELLYQRLVDHAPSRAEQVLRGIVKRQPTSAWAVRELGFHLERDGRESEARDCLTRAKALEPGNPAVHHLAAELALRRGDTAEAIAAFRQAITLDADNDYAIRRLLELCATPSDAHSAARFIADQFARQTLFGNGVLAFQQAVGGALPAEQVTPVIADCHRHRPDLWQTWAASIDQHVATNQLDEADRLADEAVERFPLHPPVWLRRAHVHHVRLDRPRGIDALREALRIDPINEVAVDRLAEAYAADGQFAEALALMDRTLVRAPRNAVFHARRANLLWVSDQPDAAIAAVEHALELQPTIAWIWSIYQQYCQSREREDQPQRLARRLVEQRPGDPALRLIHARLLCTPEHLSQCLEALDAAIGLDPRLREAYDLRAEALVYAHRIDEALKACKPEVFGDDPPLELRGRSIWVLARSGRVEQAMNQMQKLLDETPGYYWGWTQLAEWARQSENLPTYRLAAQRMVSLAPHDAEALAFLGHVSEIEAGQPGTPTNRIDDLRQKAIDRYTRAFELEPQLVWCGRSLIRLLLDDQQIVAARKIFDRLGPHLLPAFRLATQIEIEAAAQDLPATLGRLTELARTPDADPEACTEAVHYLRERLAPAAREQAAKALVKLAGEAGTQPALVAELVRWRVQDRHYFAVGRLLRKLNRRSHAWRLATVACLETLVDNGETGRATKLARRCRRDLADRSDAVSDLLWGTAGMACAAAGQWRLACRILDDWQQRQHVRPWMLANLLNALVARRRYDRAQAVCAAALRLPPDDIYPILLTFQALLALRAQDTGTARQALAPIQRDVLPLHHRFQYDCVAAALLAGHAEDAAAGEREGLLRIQRAKGEHLGWSGHPVTRRAARLAEFRIAQRRGGLRLLLTRFRNWCG
ncbi:MAG: C39 family peptidase [Phycisphaeraceae bacterium]